MKITKSIITVVAILCIANLGLAQEYMGNKEDLDQILKNAKNFSEYVVDANYEMIGASYTVDAKIFPNDSKILTGKDAILAYWKLPEGISTVHHKLMPEEIKVIGNEAYDYGYYEGTTQKADGSESSWKGKYVVIWRKENGEWKMYLDIWNSVR